MLQTRESDAPTLSKTTAITCEALFLKRRTETWHSPPFNAPECWVFFHALGESSWPKSESKTHGTTEEETASTKEVTTELMAQGASKPSNRIWYSLHGRCEVSTSPERPSPSPTIKLQHCAWTAPAHSSSSNCNSLSPEAIALSNAWSSNKGQQPANSEDSTLQRQEMFESPLTCWAGKRKWDWQNDIDHRQFHAERFLHWLRLNTAHPGHWRAALKTITRPFNCTRICRF